MSKSIKGVDLTGKTVILSPKYYHGDEGKRTFICKDGFGCSPTARGTAVYGTFSDGKEGRVERYEIKCLAGEPGKEGR
jgi:hypothetical protein